MTGPNGCKTPEECKALCDSNPEACRGFGPQSQNDQDRNDPQNRNDRGQDRAMERRGFETPPGQMPCKSEEDCRKAFENRDQFRGQDGAREDGNRRGPDMERRSPQSEEMDRESRTMPNRDDFRSGDARNNMTPEQQQMFNKFQETGTPPPPSSFAPPTGSGTPPPRTFENSGSFSPPAGSFQQSPPPPSAQRKPSSFLASVAYILDQLLK